MSWELKAAGEHFPAFAAEWDRLNGELYGSHPFFDSRFIGPLLVHFGKGDELLCVHRGADAIDGALILHPLSFGRWSLFLPSQTQAGAVMLKDARLLETLLPALPGHAWSLDLLSIDPAYAPDWSGLRLPRIVIPHAITMAVATEGDFNHYWQARPKNLISNIRRYQHRAEETTGPLTVATITDPAKLVDALARYGQLESAGWKGKQGTAIAPDNAQGQFYADMLGRFAASGQALVMELRAGEQLVASRLLIRHEQMWNILKTTYDETQSAFAPGRLLLHAVLERACAEMRSGIVEFYTNATRDQAEWATALRPIPHHQIFRNDLVAGLLGIIKTLRRRPSPTKDTDAFDPLAVHGYPSITALPPAALQLFQQAETYNPEFSAGWFANLQQTVFGDDPGVCYYVAEHTGQPVAILPVRLARHGIARRVEALGNYYTSLYSPILAPEAAELDLAALLQAASRDHGGAHVMRFAPMDPASSGNKTLLTALRSRGWIPFKFYCFGNWYLKDASDWKTYLEQRDGQLRSTLKRKGKKFAAEGGTLEIITAPAQAEAAITNFNRVYSRSWKKPEPYPEFIPGLIRWLADKGWLRLGIASLHGQPIAAQLWIVNAGRARIFKLAYDEAHAHHASGTLLTAHLMEHVIDRDKVQEVDYLIGDDDHKKLWMNHRRERWGIVAYNPASIIGLGLLGKEIVGRILRKAMAMTQQSKPMHTHWQLFPISQFDAQTTQWDALQRNCANLPFLESGFLKPLIEEFGTGQELLAFGSEDGKPCAAAILTKRRFGIWQTFQPSQLPLGAWISRTDDSPAELAKSLLRALPGFNLNLSLTQIDPLFQPRPEEEPCIKTMDYIDTAWVDIDQAFDTYWEARGKNLKTNTRKQRTKLQTENVTLSIECLTQPAAVAQAIEDYGVLESAGWKGKDGTAVHPDNAQGRFYRKMLENLCAQGRGRIYRYRFNDKVVAMDLCIEAGDRIVILKTAYDETYKTVSPSTLMRHDEFRELFDSGKFKRIEFYGKIMEWHTRWSENKRALYHLTTYRSALITKLHAWRQKSS
ncbi:MAG: GNAT family N-acetyltransferase [Rhodocyclaceae bacterium]|nr:GNAT family N-acetyltransferase [Rhodocyclaceae bacterium]